VLLPGATTMSKPADTIGKELHNDKSLFDACSNGDLPLVQSMLKHSKEKNNIFAASIQEEETGLSPLMAAARNGQLEICRILLDEGAPWNAVDRQGKCAGNYATENEHWDVVNLLVDAGTQAELILGASIRLAMKSDTNQGDDDHEDAYDLTKENKDSNKPVELEPCSKPDYLQRNVRYNAENTLLLDDDDDAVMMQWERPLMDAHASIITSNGRKGTVVLNIGFGLGIIDTALQKYDLALHVIIEAHPTVHQKMINDGWGKKSNVRICFGRWQEELPKLLDEGISFDGMFYDTYAESFTDLEDFHTLVSKGLKKPDGIYSFFNGLAPDNIFFHGVACQCVKVQLEQMGFEVEFAQCEIQVDEKEWNGVRRKYWFGRETYYLPIITWNKSKLPENLEGSEVGSQVTETDETKADEANENDGVKNKKVKKS